MEIYNIMNIERQSTGTILLLGMVASSFSGTASNAKCFSAQELQTYEAKFIFAQRASSPIDQYITYQYNTAGKLTTSFAMEESSFLNAVQNFGKQQIILDQDFSDTLDELLISKINSAPTRRRF